MEPTLLLSKRLVKGYGTNYATIKEACQMSWNQLCYYLRGLSKVMEPTLLLSKRLVKGYGTNSATI